MLFEFPQFYFGKTRVHVFLKQSDVKISQISTMLRFIEALPKFRTLGIQAGVYKGSFDEDECAVEYDSDESQFVLNTIN